MGSKVYTTTLSTNNAEKPMPVPQPIHANPGDEKKSITGIKFQVKQFTIQLNQSETAACAMPSSSSDGCTQVASFKVNDVRAFIESRPESLQANGTLGRLEIYDTSPHAGLYTDRFMTSGQQALEFEFFKYSGPLDYLYHVHEFDMSLKLTMSSVKYIHTQRFLISLTSYFQQFNQLQDALSKMRALSQMGLSAGNGNIACAAQRSSRLKLDVKTEAPIIVIPINNRIEHALILNLGNIEVTNKFRAPVDDLVVIDEEASSNPGSSVATSPPSMNKRPTLSHSFSLNESSPPQVDAERECLLDLIDVKFTDTHLYSASRYALDGHLEDNKNDSSDCADQNSAHTVEFVSFGFKQQSHSILKQQSDIFFRLERNLENELSHKSPDWYIHSKFSEVSVRLDLEQYKMIRGILDRNLGEPIVQSRSLVAAANFIVANTSLETVLSGRVWKGMCINFDLENVGIELYNHTPKRNGDLSTTSLAFLSFIKR
jgi:vacuolar protein sorting-associated protein 13D